MHTVRMDIYPSDVNECDTDTANCSPNATCTNIIGSFTCDCNQGYNGNGITCVGTCIPSQHTHNKMNVHVSLPQILTNVLLVLITVPLMLHVPTILEASPVPVTRDTVEMDYCVWVSS